MEMCTFIVTVKKYPVRHTLLNKITRAHRDRIDVSPCLPHNEMHGTEFTSQVFIFPDLNDEKESLLEKQGNKTDCKYRLSRDPS